MNIDQSNIKLSLIVSVVLFFSNNAFSQGSVGLRSSLNASNPSLSVDYDKLLDREFTRVLTGQNTNFGTFASLGTKDEIVTLAGHVKLDDRSSLGINVKGGLAEGIVPLFQSNNVASNVSVGLQLNLGMYGVRDTIYADATMINSFLISADSILIAVEKKKMEVDGSANKIAIEIRKNKLDSMQKTSILATVPEPSSGKTIVARDSLQLVREKLLFELWQLAINNAALEKELANITEDQISVRKQSLNGSARRSYQKAFQKLYLDGYNIKWWSVGAVLNNRSFLGFDEAKVFEDQIISESFNGWELKFAFNQYKLKNSSSGSFYQSLGISLLIEDNFSDLSKKTIEDFDEISPAPQAREIQKSRTVYVGEYETNLVTPKISYDRYQFITRNQNLAIHFNPSVLKPQKEDFKVDTIIGLLLGFKNEEKENTIINTELFYHVTNLFPEKDKKLKELSSIGVRLVFPITFSQKIS